MTKDISNFEKTKESLRSLIDEIEQDQILVLERLDNLVRFSEELRKEKDVAVKSLSKINIILGGYNELTK